LILQRHDQSPGRAKNKWAAMAGGRALAGIVEKKPIFGYGNRKISTITFVNSPAPRRG
jgi:hypothetical protein